MGGTLIELSHFQNGQDSKKMIEGIWFSSYTLKIIVAVFSVLCWIYVTNNDYDLQYTNL